jgi:hypothetical protein
MTRKALLAALAVLMLAAAGCAGLRGPTQSFHSVDLSGDLPPDALKRYQSISEDFRSAGHAGPTTLLEHTNGWPLGLLVYWRRGSVLQVTTPSGEPAYEVSSTRGYGPLSFIYVRQADATFDAKGKRVAAKTVWNVLKSEIATGQESEVLLADGQRQKMSMVHILHMHPFNIHKMGHHTTVSLISMPNPLEVDLPSGH